MKRIFATLAMSFTLVLSVAATAQAGDNSSPPDDGPQIMAGPCGSSYTHVGHYGLDGGRAYMDVYYSSTSRRNCLVVNHAGYWYGRTAFTEARIWPSGYSKPSCPSSTGCDAGNYAYYAGPVYTPSGVDMSNRCVSIEGWMRSTQRVLTNIHCG